jgi:luciferase family oxidoreductase group 1
VTAHALRRTLASNPDAFPHDVLELLSYFHPEDGQPVRAVPGVGLTVPIYILGSSLFGAQVAAALGVPFAFASHFAAMQMIPAVEIYRTRFQPSGQRQRPHVILGVNVVAADTDEKARLLATSGRQAFASLRAGKPIALPPPSREWEKEVVPFDANRLEGAQSVSFVGSPQTIERDIESFINLVKPDELIVVSHIYDHAARLRSYEIVAGTAGPAR